ncbi:MAG TPA: sigma-70 family RNA polymerase sigma factor [Tepidisphaeraceae bacterium]|nr:sigma-70 family RNA polymerase sigma factor [Tepidisphaeraceae bacterium]
MCASAVPRREEMRDAGPLLRRLATARAMDRLRQRYRRQGREDACEWNEQPSQEDSPGDRAQESELSELLRNALSRIPPRQAQAFCLFCLEGMTYEQIAGHLKVSIDNVGVLLHRARTALREELAPVVKDERLR